MKVLVAFKGQRYTYFMDLDRAAQLRDRAKVKIINIINVIKIIIII